MKKHILTSLLLYIGLITAAQGNLQFNRVVNLKYGTTYTVPAGKVLKIESVNQNAGYVVNTYAGNCMINCPGCGASSGVTCYYNDLLYFKLGSAISFTQGGGTTYVNTGGACSVCPPTKTTALTIPAFTFPIWVPEGEEMKVYVYNVVVSCIEFNIVQ